jgi:RNA polymerase sigma-70 factor (ECF subfamily)
MVRAFVAADYRRVVATVATATGTPDGAEDAVQDAVVKALEADDPPRNIRAWVTVVAINEVRTRQRREGAYDRALNKIEAQNTPDAADSSVERLALLDAIAGLPERQRITVLMHYYLDTSIADIARALEVTEGTVKTQLHRGRATLAATLGGVS